MGLCPPRLEEFLALASGATRAAVTEFYKVSGGAIQENWLLDAVLETENGPQNLSAILRTDAPAVISASRTRAEEFALLSALHKAGVRVPEPLWMCEDRSITGRSFFLMRRVPGVAAAHRVVREHHWGGERGTLAWRLGAELATIHRIRYPHPDFGFLDPPSAAPGLAVVAECRAMLDGYPVPMPALEWGLRWLELNAPPLGTLVLCHRDYRTGNYILDDAGIAAILDWEFTGWSDPHEDLGWICAKCWRVGVNGLECGGIGSREDFYAGYEAAGGPPIYRSAVRYWEIAAHARWACIALEQGERQASGGQDSLELALTAHIVPQLQYEILTMMETG